MWNHFSKFADLYKGAGWFGVLLMTILLLVFLVKGDVVTFLDKSEKNAIEQAAQDNDREEREVARLVRDLDRERNERRIERIELYQQVQILRDEVADLRAHLRMRRRAEQSSYIAKAELDEDDQLEEFNAQFGRLALETQGVVPRDAIGKTWREMGIAVEAVEIAEKQILELRAAVASGHPKPVTSDANISVEKRPSGTYRVFWRLMMDPMVDDWGNYRGCLIQCFPYREERIK